MNEFDTIRAVEWRDNSLHLLDQRLLPQRCEYVVLGDAPSVANAIRDMVVRGAPAIGVTAAYGVALSGQCHYPQNTETWRHAVANDIACLAASRPTAVNLFWALDRMSRVIATLSGDPRQRLLDEAQRIHAEDIAANKRMGVLGAALIDETGAILTHCNTGSLATGGYGTALGVIRAAYAAGRVTQVFADETRPWLQGSRLTAWELVADSIPVTLVVEGAASYLLSRGEVRWVIVGADRIALNGDTANKIGTYNLAVSARYHGVKFMVVAPTTTIDANIVSGAEIPIENRAAEEVLYHAQQRVAAEGALAWNPAFDVTPASLIDAIVTERGVVLAPSIEKMTKLLAEPPNPSICAAFGAV